MNGKITNVSTVIVNIFLQSGGQKQALPQLDQLDQQQPLLLTTFVQLVQSGMMLQTNVSTAHYQTSPFKRMPLLENGNVSAIAHTNLSLMLMAPNHANDWDLLSLLFYNVQSFFITKINTTC